MAEIRIDNLLKKFGEFVAVEDVNITVEDGEFVFLLGPSGCGKTTTLRMLAGLEMPTDGRISIGSRNVTFLRPRYRNVGMVFQDYGLYRHMTVFGNIAYPLKVRGMPKADIEAKVTDVAKTMQITEVLQRKPDQLSGGQLQRVAIARMLVRDADVFLMDEPMSHLDAQLRGHMRAELRHLQKEIGVTTLFVTHDQLEAMTMADRIIVMKDGQMLQFATPREIFERPATEFVATFVGEPQMNVFDCRIRRSDSGYFASCDGFDVPLDTAWVDTSGGAALLDRTLRLGVRPEHISVSETQDAKHPIKAKLFAFEPTGAENLYVMDCGGVQLTTRTSTNETAHFDKTEGTDYAIGFDPGWLYLFDSNTGKTLAFGSQSDTGNTEA
ncbi:ABC transporter ATP-binding protein [Pacificoceanicola onchidii]|uniref:ABC transporter ATP-binding protein n=1 Tax=Pacificoceanicola onchidii TaxID=2562685 RepID=UPI0010A5C9D1|nr:ABC transporter ATP-binding protein [Pacificoceanicola onchidii]